MELKEMIYKRKSVRSYTCDPVSVGALQKIRDFIRTTELLYPDIKIRAEVVGKDSVRCMLPWTTQQLIAIFSEEKEGWLENVGFVFQQLDLYLQSVGLGTCWLGMGRLNAQGLLETKRQEDDGLKFVILMAFGYPKGDALRKSAAEFKRRKLDQISDIPDERLEPARLAPSSVNSQPWYFVHEGDVVHVYCAHQGLFRAKTLTEMNRIDIGIALAHLYVSNRGTFRFFKADAPVKKDHTYIGSMTL